MKKFLERLIRSILKYLQHKPDPKPPTPVNPIDIDPSWRLRPGDRDIRHWPIQFGLRSASIHRVGGSEPWMVRVSYSGLQDIPAWARFTYGADGEIMPDVRNKENVNGSIWLVREFKGQWYIGTIDYLRVGQMSKHFAVADGYYLNPKPGDKIGVMISTAAREWDGTTVMAHDGKRIWEVAGSPIRKRSGIVWTVWP